MIYFVPVNNLNNLKSLWIIIALCGIPLITGDITLNYECDPSVDCSNAVPGDQVPDPDNCNQYYLCLKAVDESVFPSDDPLDCPSGQFFNWETGNCTDENGEACKDLCINSCLLACTETDDLIALPDSCSSYGFCTTPTTFISTFCSEPNLYFDGSKCQNDSSVPNESDLHECEEGKHFDVDQARCIDDDPVNPCTPFCSSVQAKRVHLP
ncbi:hypothetical protein Avbf_12336 [Armadillidium vulgare]|nr:hypothetical protein Avbf_12336 [Armadillidium vulgare]